MKSPARGLIPIAVVVSLLFAVIAAMIWARPLRLIDAEVAAWTLDRMWCTQEAAIIREFGSVDDFCARMCRASQGTRLNGLDPANPWVAMEEGVTCYFEWGKLIAKRGKTQEIWLEVIWHDPVQQEILVLVTVLEQPFLQFDTEYPHVLLVRASVQCPQNDAPSLSIATIGSNVGYDEDVTRSKFAPWTVERRGDELLASVKGGSTWSLSKPDAAMSR